MRYFACVNWRELLQKPLLRTKRPAWATWYKQGFAARNLRRWFPDVPDEQMAAARAEAHELCREHGIMPYARERLSAEALDRIISGDDKPPTDEEPAGVESHFNGDTWTLTGNRIKTLPDLLQAADVDPKRWHVQTWRANSYEAQRAGGGIVQLWQVKASLQQNPEWMWQPVTPRKRWTTPTVKRPTTTLVIPDSQNGYRWDQDRRSLEPLHDRRAWDIAIKVAETAKPDQVVLLGDMIDFAEGSKRWPVSRDLIATTQATIEELHWWLARLRAAVPRARIVYLEGNHEDRIDRALVSSMPEVHKLRAVGDDAPLISWQRYMGLDALGIEYAGPYGLDTTVELHPDCEAAHGRTVRSGGGKTTAAMVSKGHVSQVVGHIHRLEIAHKTLHGPQGRREIFAMSPGCLCRVDGVVPAFGGRMDWQQGLGWLDHVAGHTHPSIVPIVDGVATFRGQVLLGEDCGEQIAEELGRPELA